MKNLLYYFNKQLFRYKSPIQARDEFIKEIIKKYKLELPFNDYFSLWFPLKGDLSLHNSQKDDDEEEKQDTSEIDKNQTQVYKIIY